MSFRDRRRYRGKPKRQASESDVLAWIDLSDKRDGAPPPLVTREQWRAYLKAKNPVRYRRMSSDFKWAQRMLLKIGVDPEEVRWLM